MTKTFRPALGTIQTPSQREGGSLSSELNWPDLVADHSRLSCANAKNGRSCTFTSPRIIPFWRGPQLRSTGTPVRKVAYTYRQ
jgi:cAMP phosphodiesterase